MNSAPNNCLELKLVEAKMLGVAELLVEEAAERVQSKKPIMEHEVSFALRTCLEMLTSSVPVLENSESSQACLTIASLIAKIESCGVTKVR